jgi:hypothetical protein
VIYGTTFDPATRVCTSKSIDSGYASLEEVVGDMGAPIKLTRQMAIYPGVAFSILPFLVDDPVSSALSCDHINTPEATR